MPIKKAPSAFFDGALDLHNNYLSNGLPSGGDIPIVDINKVFVVLLNIVIGGTTFSHEFLSSFVSPVMLFGMAVGKTEGATTVVVPGRPVPPTPIIRTIHCDKTAGVAPLIMDDIIFLDKGEPIGGRFDLVELVDANQLPGNSTASAWDITNRTKSRNVHARPTGIVFAIHATRSGVADPRTIGFGFPVFVVDTMIDLLASRIGIQLPRP